MNEEAQILTRWLDPTIDDFKIALEEANKQIEEDNKEIERLKKEIKELKEYNEHLARSIKDYDELLGNRNNEVDRLNNIINEFDKWLKAKAQLNFQTFYIQDAIDKLQELKGDSSDE